MTPPHETTETPTPVKSVTVTATPLAPCLELALNGDFENPDSPAWLSDGRAWLGPGRRGIHGFWLGGADAAAGRVWQTVAIPSGADPVELSFWWIVESEVEQLNDTLTVVVEWGEGQTASLVTLRATDPRGMWRPEALDLTELAGNTVKLSFVVHTDPEVPSAFGIDDVSLLACNAGEVVWLPLVMKAGGGVGL